MGYPTILVNNYDELVLRSHPDQFLPIRPLMEPIDYYTTTIMKAFKTIGPTVMFLLGGYFIFIKMPFLLFKKSISDQKKKHQVAEISDEQEEEKRNIKLLNGKTKKPEARLNQTENQEKKQSKGEDASSKKHDAPKKPIPPRPQSPEAFFNFGPDDKFTSRELKKRYFELLQKNHPDRVASMSEEFKKLAEKNTKDINKAYDQLKKKAS